MMKKIVVIEGSNLYHTRSRAHYADCGMRVTSASCKVTLYNNPPDGLRLCISCKRAKNKKQ